MQIRPASIVHKGARRSFCYAITFFIYPLLFGCAYSQFDPSLTEKLNFDVDQYQKAVAEFNVIRKDVDPVAISRFRNFYGLVSTDHEGVSSHHYGYIEIDDVRLAVHLFIPEAPVGTLVLAHGYFDHAVSQAHLIKAALREGYSVLAYDLPGHGISSGPRGDIGSFHSNAGYLYAMVARLSHVLPQPRILVGFSTGGSVALEYAIARNPEAQFTGVVLAAPLIRHTNWHTGKLAYHVLKPFVSTVGRQKKDNSHNQDYLAFLEQDPLQNRVVNTRFLKWLYRWNHLRFSDDVNIGVPLLVIQGDDDNTVDWRYNIAKIRSIKNDVEVAFVPGARHQLFNEPEGIRNEAFSILFSTFKRWTSELEPAETKSF